MLKKFYELAKAEGEGLGTAYEYATKYNVLKPYLKSRKVLIYGLPEKYGFSLDLLYLLCNPGCEVHVYEKRKEKLMRFSKLAKMLAKKGVIRKNPTIVKAVNKHYDVIASSEAIQRLSFKEMSDYFSNVKKFSKKAIIFFPNGNNRIHCMLTRLKAYEPKQLHRFLGKKFETGFIDMPPFPPGLSVRQGHMRKSLKALIPLLSMWLFIERLCPDFIKERFCHIAYVKFEK